MGQMAKAYNYFTLLLMCDVRRVLVLNPKPQYLLQFRGTRLRQTALAHEPQRPIADRFRVQFAHPP